MKTLLTTALTLGFATSTMALTLTSPTIKNHGLFPYKYGYCQPNGKGEVKLSDDISPPLSWYGAPKGTKSYAVVLRDPVSATSSHFNQVGYTLAPNSPRAAIYHWVVVNIPATQNHLPEGAGSKGFVAGGKKPGQTAYGLMGINIYTEAFSSPYVSRITFKPYTVKEMHGTYGKYDGPCAPWNDELIHHYQFTVYALNVAKLKLPSNGHFTGAQAMKAMKGHILAKAHLSASFITNPKLMVKPQH